MIKLVKSAECEVRVTPSEPWLSQRSAEQEYGKCQEIKSNIKHHVDDVGNIYIHQKFVYETEINTSHDTLYEALETLFDEWGCRPYYSYRYVRPSDIGVGSRGACVSFESLIETAWQNPWEFSVFDGPNVLSDDQYKFLNRVIEKSLSTRQK